MLGRTLLVFLALAGQASGQHVLHWVIRVSDLEKTLAFTTEVLGMKVLRHEENDEPCPLTCNGVFDTPWSKTMVGFGPEDSSYALELTYNYGIPSYDAGEGLRRFVIRMANAKEALERASQKHGLEVNGNVVTGPDAYKYELLEKEPALQVEPFRSVVLSAADPSALGSWYADLLGMKMDSSAGGAVQLSFPSLPVSLAIEPTPNGAKPRIEQWEGRNAIALPEEAVRAINDRLLRESPELIIHTMRELHEKLGTLFILILRDIAGYEVCLVSIETFDPSVREATNYVGPDWAVRKETLEKVAGLQALDAARKKMLEEMQLRMGGGAGDEDDDDDDDDDEEEEEEPKTEDKAEL